MTVAKITATIVSITCLARYYNYLDRSIGTSGVKTLCFLKAWVGNQNSQIGRIRMEENVCISLNLI